MSDEKKHKIKMDEQPDKASFASHYEMKTPPGQFARLFARSAELDVQKINFDDETRRPAGKAYKILPEDVLDLHGCTSSEAEAKTEYFLQHARFRNIKALRIITGKGLHSKGVPVLQNVVEGKLLDLKRQGWPISYSWERKKKRSSGSLVVYFID